MKKRILKIGAVVLGVALVLGLALPGIAAAQPQQEQKRNQASVQSDFIKGQVVSIAQNGKSLVVQKSDGTQVTVTVDSNTKYFLGRAFPTRALDRLQERLQNAREKFKNIQRGLGLKKGQAQYQPSEDDEDVEEQAEAASAGVGQLPGLGLAQGIKAASFSDIAAGDTVIVRVMPNETLAKQIFILKAPVIAQVKGTVTALDADSMIITRSDNSTIELKWDQDTRFVLRGVITIQGQTATVTYNSDSKLAKLVTINPPAPASSTTQTST